jgi:hypothetical protein
MILIIGWNFAGVRPYTYIPINIINVVDSTKFTIPEVFHEGI